MLFAARRLHGSPPLLSLALSLALASACGRSKDEPSLVREVAEAGEAAAVVNEDPAGLAGRWRAQLDSPGGELGFGLIFEVSEGGYAAEIQNGEERLPVSSVGLDGAALILRIDSYDSQIEARVDGENLRGTWSKAGPKGRVSLAFSASKGDAARLRCDEATAGEERGAGEAASPASVAGAWDLTFHEEDGSTYVGRAELSHQAGDPSLRGTILTDTGDYRYLEGCYHEGQLGLSVFDGAHAFLFRAEVGAGEVGAGEGDAAVMRGEFWSRDSYHATFEATPIPAGGSDRLADPWTAVSLAETNEDRRFRFAFPDLDGQRISSEDPRFAGKVVIVEIFGSWCPNCNDQAALLSRWHRQYNDSGLEVVGLAYEFSGDAARDTKILRSYAERHRILYPLLLAGTSAKAEAAASLPDLDRVAAYPTTIFIGRDGEVRKIYSGYFGPATGPRHRQMVAEHEQLLHDLLAERVGAPPAL